MNTLKEHLSLLINGLLSLVSAEYRILILLYHPLISCMILLFPVSLLFILEKGIFVAQATKIKSANIVQ